MHACTHARMHERIYTQVLQMLVGGGYLLLPQTTAFYSAELGRYVHEFPCEAPCLREWIRKSHEDELLRIEQDYLHTRFHADLQRSVIVMAYI